jgi:hypothetical protein
MPNAYICYPNLVISNTSESKIQHEKTILSKTETGYFSLCFYNINLNDYNLFYFNLLDISLLKKDDTVESFIERCLLHKLQNINKVNVIKKRFVLDFFTIKDIKKILSSHSFIGRTHGKIGDKIYTTIDYL